MTRLDETIFEFIFIFDKFNTLQSHKKSLLVSKTYFHQFIFSKVTNYNYDQKKFSDNKNYLQELLLKLDTHENIVYKKKFYYKP